MSKQPNFFYNIEQSALITFIGIILLFSGAVLITLIAPSQLDPTWTEPTNSYQVQMHEVSDPNLYISSAGALAGLSERQYVYHLKQGYTLLAFQETELTRITASPELQKYITKVEDSNLKLTSRLLLLRTPKIGSEAEKNAEELRKNLQKSWESEQKPAFTILELYDPKQEEAFAVASGDTTIENWVDKEFTLSDDAGQHEYHKDVGVIYVKNPHEYRITRGVFGQEKEWHYDPNGAPVQTLDQLKSHELAFRSRAELISLGEHIVAIEGCWYCHTDQTRTLVQDVVLNGSDSFPAPPSSASEYIYQKITFPGTRRIGPDLSRVAVKRPSRDWHKSHFWSPKTASKGSIMPSFRHFFDDDPRGTSDIHPGIPNYKFEAVFQYLMTKGTRITPPTQAWWLGKDPVKTKEIIEGRKTLQ